MAPSLDDDFVNIWMNEDATATATNMKKEKDSTDYYSQWVDGSSAKLPIPSITGADTLRRLYPKHSLVLTQGYGMSILSLPGASVTPLETNPLVTNLVFAPLPRAAGVPGVLLDQVEYGAFKIGWKQSDYLVYMVTYPFGFGKQSQYFVLHEGPEEVSRLFLLAAGAYANALHDEIWVFNQGFWSKDHGLWAEIQKARWEDVILKEEFKEALKKDVNGFFASEAIYKELAIPWKRGLIMYGPPGNGKTISLKTIMKTCGDKGFAPLYVKSFQSYKGEEGAMADVFSKARQLSPCVIILEDLDSLINDRNRSFFLNQMDGLEGNDGLLIIGTTNHFDRLDPALSTRPSRFDRKYKFDDPDEEERKLYVQYWQNKLAPNSEIDFPDRLITKVVNLTDKFSFAYLKEAFVSSLVTFVGIEGKKPAFESILIDQINTLRKQLDKSISNTSKFQKFSPNYANDEKYYPADRQTTPTRPPRPDPSTEQSIRALLDALSERAPRVESGLERIYQGNSYRRPSSILHDDVQNNRDIRALLDSLSDSLASLDLPSVRSYDTVNHRPDGAYNEGRNIRVLLDRITAHAERENHVSTEDRSFYSPDSSNLNHNHIGQARMNLGDPSMYIPALPQFGSDHA